ncbi:hypothetical protein J6590_104250, partial [Homalodisca vitripennis]
RRETSTYGNNNIKHLTTDVEIPGLKLFYCPRHTPTVTPYPYNKALCLGTHKLKISALDWQSLPERLCSRTPASTVLYRTGHSVINYSFAVVLCVSESVKDIFRLHACLQDSSLFPTLTDHNLALNNSRLRLGTSHENKGNCLFYTLYLNMHCS